MKTHKAKPYQAPATPARIRNAKRPLPCGIGNRYDPLTVELARWRDWHLGIPNAPEPPDAEARERQAARLTFYGKEIIDGREVN